MEKISREAFKRYLMENPSRFCGSLFRANMEKVLQAVEKAGEPLLSSINPRKVQQARSNSIQFVGGSWLYFETGMRYFLHTTASGKRFLLTTQGSDPEKLENVIVYNI